jgi:hypothetical protein
MLNMSIGRRLAAVSAAILLLASVRVVRAETSFPQEIDSAAGKITVYQPQPEKLAGNTLTGRAAFSLTAKGKAEPVFGALWFTSRIEADQAAGIAELLDLKVTNVKWPESTSGDEATLTKAVESAAAGATVSITTDRLSSSLANAEREQKSLEGLKNDPPKILFAKQLSVLLLYDGPPSWSAVENSKYERAINTPYVVVREKGGKTCWFGNGTLWYQASDPLGPWQPNAQPPADLLQMIPKPEDEVASPKTPLAVVTATEPTELIDTEGEPSWKPVGKGELLYVENTETPWLREVATNQMYVLLSGRWFRSGSENGPWTFVRGDQLSAPFKSIPTGSDIGGVRVSVAGTEEAEDAMLDAAIPQTAAINRSTAKLEVQYDGAPKFENIPGTKIALAQNTATQVLEIGGKYYAVDNGVWFVSTGASGPWAVADDIPEDQIQQIPPSSPAYNTTYVHVYQATPQVVYVGYTPGYMWSYPYYGVPVYGTGWYYPPYPGYYYPRPYSYGFHVGYNPWTGWNFGMSWNVGFMHFGVGWGGGYGPYYRPYGCGGWYGGYRGWGYNSHYYSHTSVNVSRNTHVSIGNNMNYGNRTRVSNNLRTSGTSRSLPTRPNLYGQPETRARNVDRATAQAQLKQARPAPGRTNNVLADRDGNVVRQTPQGLQERANGKWQSVDTGAAKAQAQQKAGSVDTAAARQKAQNVDRSAAQPKAQSVDRSAAQQRAPSVDRSSVQRDYQARQRGASREAARPKASAPAARPASVSRPAGGVRKR